MRNSSEMIGVYQITCRVTGKRYIGSSQNIEARWSQHKTDLKAGRHINKHLQRAWNKHGCETFSWTILEHTASDKQLEVEQKWLDEERPEFNGTMNATSPMLGRKFTPEQRAKISAALKGRVSNRRGAKLTSKQKAKISAALKGNTYRRGKKSSESTKAKLRAFQKKRWETHSVSKATSEKLSRIRKGKHHSSATKAILSAKQIAYQKIHGNPMSGKKRPDLAERNRKNRKNKDG